MFELFLGLGADEDQLDFPIVFTTPAGKASLTARAGRPNLRAAARTCRRDRAAAGGTTPTDPVQVLSHEPRLRRPTSAAWRSAACATAPPHGQAMLVPRDGSGHARATPSLRHRRPQAHRDRRGRPGRHHRHLRHGRGRHRRDHRRPGDPRRCPSSAIDEPTIVDALSRQQLAFAGQEGTKSPPATSGSACAQELDPTSRCASSRPTAPTSSRCRVAASCTSDPDRDDAPRGLRVQVSAAEVVFQRIDDQLLEPIEHVIIDVPEELRRRGHGEPGPRKGEMKNMMTSGRVRMEFLVPARGLIGFRAEFISQTRGTGICTDLPRLRAVTATCGRGRPAPSGRRRARSGLSCSGCRTAAVFVAPGNEVYPGMVVGENARERTSRSTSAPDS